MTDDKTLLAQTIASIIKTPADEASRFAAVTQLNRCWGAETQDGTVNASFWWACRNVVESTHQFSWAINAFTQLINEEKLTTHQDLLVQDSPFCVAARAWLAKNKPLAEDETVSGSGKRGKMSRVDDVLVVKWEDGQTSKYTVDDLKARYNWRHRLAFFDKHAPPKLKANQVLMPPGLAESVWTLRWHNGQPEALDSGSWKPYGEFGVKGYEAGDTWFRANCPHDRFVTDDGRVLEFRLNDEGEAFAVGQEGSPTGDRINLSDFARFSTWRAALYRFRDIERAKWSFGWLETGGIEVATARFCLVMQGHFGPAGWVLVMDREMPPTWVRKKAEEMWREKQKEMPRFKPIEIPAFMYSYPDIIPVTPFVIRKPRAYQSTHTVGAHGVLTADVGLPQNTPVRVTVEVIE